jgi:2-oxoisovalerate dehydrogenase E1 component beta subunit
MATMVEAIRAGIWEEMERDPDSLPDWRRRRSYGGAFKVTDGLIDQFGAERVVDTRFLRAAIVGAACGAALMGMKPWPNSNSSTSSRADSIC